MLARRGKASGPGAWSAPGSGWFSSRPLRVRVSTVKQTSRAMVSGRAGQRGVAGGLAAAGAHAVRSRAAGPAPSRLSASRVLNGTDFAPFLTRHTRCAPVPENRIQRSMEKKPRSARFSCPGAEACLRARRPGRSPRRGSRRPRRRSSGRSRCGRAR